MCDEHGRGCRCRACHAGNPHPKPNERAIELALTRAGYPAPLRLVQRDQNTTVLRVAPSCDRSMTCDCHTCQQERAPLIKRGGIGNGNANPFRRAA